MISFEAVLFGLGGLLLMGPRMGGTAEHHGVMLGGAFRRPVRRLRTPPSRRSRGSPGPTASGDRC